MSSETVAISPVRGAAAGDVVGSVHEHRPHKSEAFTLLSGVSRFTDDTVLTAAFACAVTRGEDYADACGGFTSCTEPRR